MFISMRDIKFRIWDGKEMLNDWLVLSQALTMVVATQLARSGIVVMQYTGLRDKNGKDIYEGDLFGIKNRSGELEIVGEVIFDTDLAQFTIKYTNGGWGELWQHLIAPTNKAKDVIGNIYENPDLTKN